MTQSVTRQRFSGTAITRSNALDSIQSIHKICEAIALRRLRRQNQLEPHVFFHKWIPKIYGVDHTDTVAFRRACLVELKLYYVPTVKDKTVEEWHWDPSSGKPQEYRSDLPLVVNLLDEEYTLMEAVGRLPQRRVV